MYLKKHILVIVIHFLVAIKMDIEIEQTKEGISTFCETVKNGFELLSEVRLELDKISAVKTKWKK